MVFLFWFSKGKLVSWPSLQKLWEGIPGAENLCPFLVSLPVVFVWTQVFGTWYPFPAPFLVSLRKGVKRKVFRRKTYKNVVFVRKLTKT